jgi:hypothetical protein
MPDNAFGFMATEYVSEGGTGACMVKLKAAGWVVSIWLPGSGYMPIPGPPSASLAEALRAYQEWIASRLAGEVEF